MRRWTLHYLSIVIKVYKAPIVLYWLQHPIEIFDIQVWMTFLELSKTLFLFFERKVRVVKNAVHHDDESGVGAFGSLFLVFVWGDLAAVRVIWNEITSWTFEQWMLYTQYYLWLLYMLDTMLYNTDYVPLLHVY